MEINKFGSLTAHLKPRKSKNLTQANEFLITSDRRERRRTQTHESPKKSKVPAAIDSTVCEVLNTQSVVQSCGASSGEREWRKQWKALGCIGEHWRALGSTGKHRRAQEKQRQHWQREHCSVRLLSVELNGEFDSEKREAHKPHSADQGGGDSADGVLFHPSAFSGTRTGSAGTQAGAQSITQRSSVCCRCAIGVPSVCRRCTVGVCSKVYHSVICRSGSASRRSTVALQ